MIADLRRRHRNTAALGWFAIPLVLSLAWIHRPSTGQTSVPLPLTLAVSTLYGVGFDGQNRAGAEAWYDGKDLFEDAAIVVRFRASDEAQILTLWAGSLLEPDLLIYWRAESANSDDLGRARLLGRWSTPNRAEVLMPLGWEGGGQLVLFSLGHMAVVARSRVLPSELP